MAFNISQWVSAGLDRVQYGVRSSAGYLMGATGTIAAGADDGMGLLYAASAEYSVPEAEQVNINANDSRIASFLFASAEASSFTLELGVNDLNFIAAAQGTPIVTQGDWDMVLVRPGSLTFNNIIFLLTSQASSYEAGSIGTAGYRHLLLPNVRLTYLGAQGMSSRSEHTYRFSAVVNSVDKWPWGTALEAVTDGDAVGDGREFMTDNRISMHTHIGNGADSSFTLDYTPVAASSAKVALWQDGVVKTYTTNYTVDTSTRVVTLVAVPDASVVTVVVYEHT